MFAGPFAVRMSRRMSQSVTELDRLAPTSRPAERAIGYHLWRELLFVHWRLPADEIARLLPPGLSLDTWEGDAWVGLVPFRMAGVRPWWSPWGFAFAETNVRTYVYREGRDPGVWFFSLDAANSLAVLVAPTLGFELLSRSHVAGAPRRSRAVPQPATLAGPARRRSIDRRGNRPAAAGAPTWQSYVRQSGARHAGKFPRRAYLLYAMRRGRLLRGQVHHMPYPLRLARAANCDESLLAANGIHVESPSCHAMFSEGVDVEIFPLRTVSQR